MQELGTYTAHLSTLVLNTSSEEREEVVHLAGHLDQHTSRWFGEQALARAERRPVRLVLDMGALHLLDSAGIRSLVLLHRALVERDVALAVVTDSAHLRKLFRISGLDQVLTVADSLAELRGEDEDGGPGSAPATAG
jgi:anti-anti-sigma factor